MALKKLVSEETNSLTMEALYDDNFQTIDNRFTGFELLPLVKSDDKREKAQPPPLNNQSSK